MIYSLTTLPAFTPDTTLILSLLTHTTKIFLSDGGGTLTKTHKPIPSAPSKSRFAFTYHLTFFFVSKSKYVYVNIILSSHLEKTLSRLCYWVQKNKKIKSTLQQANRQKCFPKIPKVNCFQKIKIKIKNPKENDAPHGPTVWEKSPPETMKMSCGESADAGSRFLPSVSRSAAIKVQLFLSNRKSGASVNSPGEGKAPTCPITGGQTLRDNRHTWRQRGVWTASWRLEETPTKQSVSLLFSPPLCLS